MACPHLGPQLLICLAAGLATAEGARELTDSEDVRARREATRAAAETPAQPSPAPTPAGDETEAAAAPVNPRDRADSPAWSLTLVREPPPGAQPPLVVLRIEQGWYGMEVANSTQPSGGPGSLGRAYEVGYRIDPFAMTRVSGSGRIGRYGLAGSWASDPADRDAGEALSLAAMLFSPEDGGWWQASAAWARLRGTATTSDSAGDAVDSTVDSTWRTFSIERRYYPALLWGVQYEALAMPSAYSLDDPDGQVIAIFDDTTRWRTLSVFLGVDSANAAAIERRSGLRPLYEARVGVGLGQLHYDAAGARAIAAGYGYDYNDYDGMLITLSGEAALGVQGSLAWRGLAIELAVGGRARLAWFGTGGNQTAEGESPDYGTLELNSELTTAMYGLFARVGVVF